MVIDETLYMSILQISGYRCSYCGEGLDDKLAQVDFKVPRSLGGDKTVENLVASCKVCAKLKGHKTLEEFRAFIFDSIALLLDKSFEALDKVEHLIDPHDLREVERVLIASKVRLKRFVEQRKVVFYFEQIPPSDAIPDAFTDVSDSQLN